eukprot:1996064-Alexandrium_andersonii.AAC.1
MRTAARAFMRQVLVADEKPLGPDSTHAGHRTTPSGNPGIATISDAAISTVALSAVRTGALRVQPALRARAVGLI